MVIIFILYYKAIDSFWKRFQVVLIVSIQANIIYDTAEYNVITLTSNLLK